jgi:hypothetical protein
MSESMDLMRQQLEESLEGSLKSIARDAELVMLLVDVSDSMNERMRNGKRKIDALRDVVKGISPRPPMIAFGGPFDAQVRFVDSVPDASGGTPLHLAIPYAKQYGANRVLVVSDGYPDLTEQCFIEAKSFGGQIDVIYVGNEGDMGSDFLDQLARLTGGKRYQGDLSDMKKLTGQIIGLLCGEVETKSPIQGAGFTTVDEPVEPVEDEDFEDEDDEDDDEEDDDDSE